MFINYIAGCAITFDSSKANHIVWENKAIIRNVHVVGLLSNYQNIMLFFTSYYN
jgi:hypothetical protein